MDILISVTAKIVEYTVKPIGRQVGYLLSYKDNIKKLGDQVEELKAAKDRIRHDVDTERRAGKEIEDDVQNWLNEVNEMLEEADQLCDDPRHANVECSKWHFPNLMSRYQLSRKAKKVTQNVVEVQGRGNFDRIGYLPPLHIEDFISDSVKIESRNFMKDDILLALKDPKVSKIGIYGLSGVGKTTLAKEVAKQAKHDNLFDEVVVANGSESSDLERIQGEIADQLGLRFEEMTTLGKAGRLCERIKKEKAVLIVLDNIWGELDLDKLGIPSQDNYKLGIASDNYMGCKLLLTSRNQDILQKNGTQKEFRLEVLNDTESWRLFGTIANDAVKNTDLQDIAIQVAKRCAGLPILIVTMAKSLKNKNIHYWKDALNNLRRADQGEVHEVVFSALEFSYNQLDDEVKLVFLLCGVNANVIWVSDLLKYVIGLGILKNIHTIEEVRNKLYKSIGDLTASCLLLDNDANEIKMHDIVSEVAVQIASRDQYVFTMKRNDTLQDWPSKDFLERCTQIILLDHCIQKLPERLDCPNLKFLHLSSIDNPRLEIPNSFFKGMENLEALDLTGMVIPSLPTSLSSLTKLKTLCLDYCSLKDMAGIGALKKLEILSFINSSMEEFPCELGQLTHLRMLDLSHSGIKVIPPNIVSKFTKLEELYMGKASIKWEVESSTKQNKGASLAELRHLTSLTTLEIQTEAWILLRDIMFEKLENYKVVIGDTWEWPNNNKIKKLLKLKLDTDIHWEHGIMTLIKSVEDLHLDKVHGISNILFQLNGDGFQPLKYLHIQNNREIQHIINSMGRNQTHVLFPKLERLVLQNLNKLEKICHGPLTANSFGNLTLIKVKSCGQLNYVFLISIVKEFPQLVEIEVSDCSSMKNIVFIESMSDSMAINKIEFTPLRFLTLQNLLAMDGFCSNTPTLFSDAKVSLPNLETLKLSSINLNTIWDDGSAANSFERLANLIVEDCVRLKHLFTPLMARNLKNLKRLEISKCYIMEEIIARQERNNEIALDEEAGFWKLEEIIINDMKNLKTAWHYQFVGVKILEVNQCEKLETIFPSPGDMQKALGSLEIMKVCDCGLVEEIFQFTANGMHTQEVTTQLKKLVLRGLPKMKQIWSMDPHGLVHFFNLQVVQIENCGNLEYVFPFSIAHQDLSRLEHLNLYSCGIKQIVSKKDGPMEETPIFELNHLTYLRLYSLIKLKGFYAVAHTLECQSLTTLFVYNCGLLTLFNIRSTTRCKKGTFDHQLHFSMPQSLFAGEEVIGNLECLLLHSWDANMILQHQVSRHLFYKLKQLMITAFEDDKATFLLWLLKKVPNLNHLEVSFCSFKEIFYDETLTDEEGRSQISTQLKTLLLLNLPKLQYLCREGSQIYPALEVLEVLQLKECSSLRNLVPSSATFCHLKYLEITKCNSLVSLMTSSTARSLFKLQQMKIEECNLLEEIVTEEVDETKSEIAFNSLLIIELNHLPRLHSFSSSKCFFKFPWLEKVVVSQCPRMQIFCPEATSTPKLRKVLIGEKVDEESYWEGDLNGTTNKMSINKVAFRSFKLLELSKYPELRELWYNQAGQRLFYNLKYLMVQNCHWLSNVLLSVNLLEALSNLEELGVRDCDTLEAVFDLSDINERAMVVTETNRLKNITLSNLPKLMHIWTQGSKMSDAPTIDNKREKGDFHASAHLKLISSKLLQLLRLVKELEVRDCESLEAMFDFKVVIDKEVHVKEASQLKKLILMGLPNLKHIWNRDLQEILSLQNLQIMEIVGCQGLKYLFPLSLSQDLHQLKELCINACGVEEIVGNEGEGLKELEFHFPRLTILRLTLLKQLKSFYPERHSLGCPSLQELNIYGCERLQIFDFSHLDSQQTLMVEKIDLPIQQSLFPLEKVSPNLKDLALNEEDCMKILNGHYEENLSSTVEILRLQCCHETPIKFLNKILQTFPNMKTLQVRHSSLKVLFPSEGIDYCSLKSPNQMKTLWLYNLEQLKQIWDDDFLSDLLEGLSAWKCDGLTSFGPPSISFTSLTFIEVRECKGLIFLMTLCTAKSLVHLKTLRVVNCEMMKEVVVTDEGIPEEIMFESLEYLEMTFLPSFKSFYSGKHTFAFPSLLRIKVKGCPKMKNFSSGVIIAPKQTRVEVENEIRTWTKDINTTIKQLIMEKVAFQSFTYLELSKHPELEEVWYTHAGQKLFCNLKSLIVQKCHWLSNILLSINLLEDLFNLEELEVRDCDTLEAVFDLSDINGRAMGLRENIPLKKITLSNLPELKHIWKHDSQETVSCSNSGDVHAGECQGSETSEAPSIENKGEKGDSAHLKLISPKLLQLLRLVKELEVRDCESLEVVFDFKVVIDKEVHVKEASQLKKLILMGLPNLKYIWNRDLHEILTFKNLQIMKIVRCQGLKHLFSVSLCQDLHQLQQLDINGCHSLEEIVGNEGEGLKELEFHFPKLTILNLYYLSQLNSFYIGRHILECPLLQTLDVYGCERLQIFDSCHLDSQQTDMPIQPALFSLEKVSPNLKQLALNEEDCMKILNGHDEANLFSGVEILRLQYFQETPIEFLNEFHQRFPNMKTLQVRCSSLKVLFPYEGIDYCSLKSPNQMKTLWLYQLEQLKQIWDDDFLSDLLEGLSVWECASLTSFGPPSISFTSLTFIEVIECKGLIFLMTLCTAKSLVHLKTLKVINCEMMKEVVVTDEGILEEITFQSLEYLEMIFLPSLKSFSSGKQTFVFPSLLGIKVKGCPKMKNFSSGVIIAPKQTRVEVENEIRLG